MARSLQRQLASLCESPRLRPCLCLCLYLSLTLRLRLRRKRGVRQKLKAVLYT